jgi:hypothetical protein
LTPDSSISAQETCARWRSIVEKAGEKQETALRTQLKVLQTKQVEERESSVVGDFKPGTAFAADSGLDESGLHDYLQLIARYAPRQLARCSLDRINQLFKAYTADDASWRALSLGVSKWTADDKERLATQLAGLVTPSKGFLRYDQIKRDGCA